MKHRLAALLILATAPAYSQTVDGCDWRASLHAVAEPLEDNTRTYANGAVRLTVTDTIEPAAGSFHLVIVGPPYDELGGPQCAVVSLGGSGFSGIDLAQTQASYDAAVGLVWTLPVSVFAPEVSVMRAATLRVTLNQSTGEIGATVR